MRIAMRSSALAIFLTACARNAPAPEQTPPQPAPSSSNVVSAGQVVRRGGPSGSLANFVAQVAPITGEGQCKEYAMPAASDARRMVSYTIGTGPVRVRASLQLDAAGKRVSYSETRGDLKMNSSAPATSIYLDFAQGTAQASNEGPGDLEVANGTLTEALQAANLGVPQRLVELIEQRCLKQ